MPISPDLSEDEQERTMRFPVPALKYTQTIMGGRSGALGLRVHGKRASVSKRLSGTPRQLDVKNFISDQAPVQEVLSTPAPTPPTLAQSAPVVDNWIKMEDSDEQGSPESTVQNPQSVVPEPVVKIVQFIPKFKGAAEMEARRRERMAARRGPGGVVARARPPPPLDFSSSSENEVEIPVIGEVSSDEFDDVGAAAVDGMDEGDEFDPSVYYCHLSQTFTHVYILYRAAFSLQPVPVQRLTALQILLRRFLWGLVPYLTRQSPFHHLTRILELVHD